MFETSTRRLFKHITRNVNFRNSILQVFITKHRLHDSMKNLFYDIFEHKNALGIWKTNGELNRNFSNLNWAVLIHRLPTLPPKFANSSLNAFIAVYNIEPFIFYSNCWVYCTLQYWPIGVHMNNWTLCLNWWTTKSNLVEFTLEMSWGSSKPFC